jgi:putative acetyltransferase
MSSGAVVCACRSAREYDSETAANQYQGRRRRRKSRLFSIQQVRDRSGSSNQVLIRAEEEKDRAAVRAVNMAAFETSAEANLVDALRAQAEPLVSLVAEENHAIVGHIMFSPVSLSRHPDLKAMGLAPMAVAPEHQRKGIGSALVRAGLERCKQLGVVAAIVVGHPEYYPRFGFSSAGRFSIRTEYDVPDEVFMALELQDGALAGKTGTAKYHAAFASV